MDTEQEIRAIAAQAAANLVPRGASLLDYLVACDVATAYVANGRDAAIATYFENVPNDPQNPNLKGPRPVALVETVPTVSAPSVRSESFNEPQDHGIPTAVGGPVPPKQKNALTLVEKTRKERATNIAKQASVAKARAHLMNLVTEAEDANLTEVMVMPPKHHEPIALGTYLASL